MTARDMLIAKFEDRRARFDRDAAAAFAGGEPVAAAIYTGWRDATAECLYDLRRALDAIELQARIGQPDPEDVACTCGGDEFYGHDPYCGVQEWTPGELVEAFGR